ncbi:hypothetical protein AKJ09_02068 [Labilithrix luteola]|uniref:Uncharacterized protein n=1 Tax=Labilithrix luteola TaxID=1391654 RepID=A0A0K1PQL1_9BACT|nr:hypothetical protein [Labilithrix luteola]AKU95404.1 hypothetical protein AKJ09_02068 [Labilithrix luteola]
MDTRTEAARRQYDANVKFAMSYSARCTVPKGHRRRVLVTGFGRFGRIGDNATGRIVSALVPGARYPETSPPTEPGAVDPPEPQLSVATTTLDLPSGESVDVCGMILPVYWDLATILIAKELEAFDPALVVMNGVAAERQPIWLELGATNRAKPLEDGSSQLRPAVRDDESFAKIIDGAPASEDARGNLLSWQAVESAARKTIIELADEIDNGVRFGDVLDDVRLAGYPRSSNTYLCNNVTYATGWLMSHPGRHVRLLRASPPLPGAINDVPIGLRKDLRDVPRVFIHWPAALATAHHHAGARLMSAIIDAQLAALSGGEAPTIGDNAFADSTLQGGETF